MGLTYEIDGYVPVVAPGAFVHPTAVLIGDVHVGPGCYVGPNASLRGDFGRLVLREGSNVQDNCTMHTFPGTDAVIEEDAIVGHGAVVHGATIGVGALVGMNCVILDGATVGARSIIGACAVVKTGDSIPPEVLAVGSPARVVRELAAEEIENLRMGAKDYQQLTERCRVSLKPAEPLERTDPDRPPLRAGVSLPVGSGARDSG